VAHVNSHEQLCPQYLLRTDEMDYHIRPVDTKHAAVLPVGREAEFRIDKDRLFLRVVDGSKKTEAYQVVSMQPSNSSGSDEKVGNANYGPAQTPTESHPSDEVGKNVNNQSTNPPPDPQPQPQH